MPKVMKESIEDLLVKNIQRDLVMSIEDSLMVGAQRAILAVQAIKEGHLPHALGQMRHFNMNEAFHRALDLSGASPTPLKGNEVIQGRSGIFNLARFNMPLGLWTNGRRSKIRRQMSTANRALLPLVQPDFFNEHQPPQNATAFFVSVFSGLTSTPLNIYIAVPDEDMKGWLFRETVADFLQHYEQPKIQQSDLAAPKLKPNVIRMLQKKQEPK